MKRENIVKSMRVEEKAAMLSGKNVWETRDIPRLQIPSIFLSDGPHGVRKQAGEGDHLGLNASLPATCFPTAATIANSWDVELGEAIGQALGREAAALNVNVLLGPGLNIKRSPLCGRNFEYFSEDPYLSGKMAASYIKGIQSQGVYACPKHFAVNSQELRRMAMDSVVDERALREIYLTAFEIAVKEGDAKAIMSSYNQVNGEYTNENKHLLKDILRDEWGYDGIVVTDWGGSNDHVAGIAARSNLEMPAPGLDSAREVIEAVTNGRLSVEELDQCVDDLVDAVLNLTNTKDNMTSNIDFEKHHELAGRAARESIVLLKNSESLLPLWSGCKVAVIGDFAFEPRYQGAGSSMVNPTNLETIENIIGNYPLVLAGSARGYKRNGEQDAILKKEALGIAKNADVVLFCFGLDELSESEGLDRNHMRIPQNQIDLLDSLVKVNNNIVGIISAGAAIEMPWQICCKSIVHGYLGGQAGAGAMLDIITGKENPSGRLNETYPFRYEDSSAFRYYPSTERTSEYRESIFVGYRYYLTSKVRVQFPFGFGLSYTSFQYDDLKVLEDRVTFQLTNIGEYDGAEVAQLYVGKPDSSIFRADRELKGFQKVFLKKGETKLVTIEFDDKTFRYWNQSTGGWELEEGTYSIMVGTSAVDIKLTGETYQSGTSTIVPYDHKRMPLYYSGMIQNVSDHEFEVLLGREIPKGQWSGELGMNDALCQMFYAKSRLARCLYKILTKIKTKSEKKGKPDLNVLFIYNMPFRSIAKMSNGWVSMEMVRGMVKIVNGHFFQGMNKILFGFVKNIFANKKYLKKLKSFRAEHKSID